MKKAISKKTALLAILGISTSFACANDLTKTENYLPDGPYRLFGAGRGNVEKLQGSVRLTGVQSFDSGPVHMDIHKYGGQIYYEMRFENHPYTEHGPFTSTASKSINDFHGSIESGRLAVTNAKIEAVKVHLPDAYDGKPDPNGRFPAPDHPHDDYTYFVDGEKRFTYIREIDKPKPLPTPPNNPYNPNANGDSGNQGQPENGADDNRKHDLAGSDNPNMPNSSPELANNGNGEVPQPQDTGKWTDTLTGALKYLNQVRIQMQYPNTHLSFPQDVVEEHAGQDIYNNPPEKQYQIDPNNSWEQAGKTGAEWGPLLITRSPASVGNKIDDAATKAAQKAANKADELKKAQDKIDKLSQTPRPGRPFTKAGKDAVKNENKIRNDGVNKCENCGQTTVPAQKSQKGVTPPQNETQVDHKIARAKNGSGTPNNGQVLCRGCNQSKGAK